MEYFVVLFGIRYDSHWRRTQLQQAAAHVQAQVHHQQQLLQHSQPSPSRMHISNQNVATPTSAILNLPNVETPVRIDAAHSNFLLSFIYFSNISSLTIFWFYVLFLFIHITFTNPSIYLQLLTETKNEDIVIEVKEKFRRHFLHFTRVTAFVSQFLAFSEISLCCVLSHNTHPRETPRE